MPSVTSSPTRGRSTSASDPQCSALFDDGTRCTLPGTNGNPNKPARRCKGHNELYQEGYCEYKAAGALVAQIKDEDLRGRIPGERDVKRMADQAVLEETELSLSCYRAAVENELGLRERHTEQFMLELDAGHSERLERLRNETKKVDGILLCLRRRKEELLKPPPLPRRRRERAATSAASRKPPAASAGRVSHYSPNKSRTHRRVGSEPSIFSLDGYLDEDSYPPLPSRPVRQSIQKENAPPGPYIRRAATESTRPELGRPATTSSYATTPLTYSAAASRTSYPVHQTSQQSCIPQRKPRPEPERGSPYVERTLYKEEYREERYAEPRRTHYPTSHSYQSGHTNEHRNHWPGEPKKEEEFTIFGFKPTTVLLVVAGAWLVMKSFGR